MSDVSVKANSAAHLDEEDVTELGRMDEQKGQLK